MTVSVSALAEFCGGWVVVEHADKERAARMNGNSVVLMSPDDMNLAGKDKCHPANFFRRVIELFILRLLMNRTLTSPLPSPLPLRERRGGIVWPFLAKWDWPGVTRFRDSKREFFGEF